MRFAADTEVPDEIGSHIFSFLPLRDVGNVLQVSKDFYAAANDQYVWKALAMSELYLSRREIESDTDFKALYVVNFGWHFLTPFIA